MEQDKINLLIGDITYQRTSCPFFKCTVGFDGCGIDRGVTCNYGATEIKVPKDCPLNSVDVEVSLD